MIKAKRLVFWLVLTLAVSIPIVVWLYHQIMIDKCLDAGGAWDYEKKHCFFEEPKIERGKNG